MPPLCARFDQARDRDQGNAQSFQVWQLLAEHCQGFRIGMPDGQCRTALIGQADESLPLVLDRRGLAVVVEKYITASGSDTVFDGLLLCGAVMCRAAVDEEEIAALRHALHKPVHEVGIAGEQTTHVVIDPACIGDCRDTNLYLAREFRPRHFRGESNRAKRLVMFGGHGQVQHDFLIPGVRIFGKTAGKGSVRQDGVGEFAGQVDGVAAIAQAIAEVVDNDADHRLGRGEVLGLKRVQGEQAKAKEQQTEAHQEALYSY